jgi:hypothetical protein
LSEFLYELAGAFENHYYGQIQRYYNHINTLQRNATLRYLHNLKGEKNANIGEDVGMQDNELGF